MYNQCVKAPVQLSQSEVKDLFEGQWRTMILFTTLYSSNLCKISYMFAAGAMCAMRYALYVKYSVWVG